ncbi:RHS repeat domain-containing protein [Motilimonas cestriensis]|uniref:RHS repeat domain-containing protein n=1 Tax=Motilimonas cestriensis TaxID=2742685 RepID=UPI003DA59CB3
MKLTPLLTNRLSMFIFAFSLAAPSHGSTDPNDFTDPNEMKKKGASIIGYSGGWATNQSSYLRNKSIVEGDMLAYCRQWAHHPNPKPYGGWAYVQPFSHCTLVDETGTPNAEGGFRYEVFGVAWHTCSEPFIRHNDGGCKKSCPPDRPHLDIQKGNDGKWYGSARCIAKEDVSPAAQCLGLNPVDLSTGEKIQFESPDYMGGGIYPLLFSRSYRSNLSAESRERINISIAKAPHADTQETLYIQPAGWSFNHNNAQSHTLVKDVNHGVRLAGFKNWSHNYQSILISRDSGKQVQITNGNNDIRLFRRNNDGSYSPMNKTKDTLYQVLDLTSGSEVWVYRTDNNYKESYNAQGQLIRRQSQHGLSHYLEYNAQGLLITVSDDIGNNLSFSYDDTGKLSILTTPKGEVINYTYDQFGNLQTVSKLYNSGKSSHKTYHYEDVRHPYGLTGITDENNVRYASWEYDDIGRVVSSIHAGNADNGTLSYSPNQTILTNSLGKQTIYHYGMVAGIKRLVTVKGVKSTNCAASSKSYSYYSDGMMKSSTDWNGVATEFIYNERNLEEKRVQAKGTLAERTIDTIWHPNFNLPTQLSNGESVTQLLYDEHGKLLKKISSGVSK